MIDSIKKWLPFKRCDSPATKPVDTPTHLNPLLQLHRDVNQLFGRVAQDSTWPWSLAGGGGAVWFGDFSQERFHPTIDIEDRPEHFVVIAELPGMDADDVGIEVRDDVVVLRGQKKSEGSSEADGYYRIERSFRAFERTIPLPGEVDPDGTDARFKKGVLTVRLAKVEPRQAARRVEIKAE